MVLDFFFFNVLCVNFILVDLLWGEVGVTSNTWLNVAGLRHQSTVRAIRKAEESSREEKCCLI